MTIIDGPTQVLPFFQIGTFVVSEGHLPGGDIGPGLVHDEDPVRRATVTVLTNNARQTLALTCNEGFTETVSFYCPGEVTLNLV